MSNRPSKGGVANADEKRLAEVERELAAVAALLPDVDDDATALTESEISNTTRLRNAWNAVKQHEQRLKRTVEKLEVEAESAKRTRGELDTERDDLAKDREALSAANDRLEERTAELAAAELELEVQRSAAKAGFADDRRAVTREAADRRDAILAEVASIEEDARARATAILADARAELESERNQLAAQRAELHGQTTALREQEVQLENTKAITDLTESMLAERYERRLQSEVADARDRLEEAVQLLDAERQRGANRARELATLRTELARFGDDPDAAKRRNDELEDQLRSLRDELSRRPPADEVAELRHRASEAADAESAALEWRQRHDQAERQLRYQLVSVGELEVLRDERDALQAQRETLRQAIAQQRADWEELQTKESSKEPFPACSTYDRDTSLARPIPTRDFESLESLAHEVRHRMASDSIPAFYYSEADVRLFLAGLASSRLHLLQGISGTGKTSLPREFFRALAGDGSAQIVEVQAGWRDRDDLFGYYNAFEKRFAESEFTKALYRALLPANSDKPMVIILDEMNLAHPEQYFGSMLSILENAVAEGGHIDLLTSILPGLPNHFDESRLPLPRNVWFVGTANHDETTVAFADKTYDRAHVQELPAQHEAFAARRMGVEDPISFTELEAAFERAARERAGEVEVATRFLNDSIRAELMRFGVGWGNRLERQLGRFVPVVLAAGGTLTEALDHLVATKLVRKLEDRFGVSPDALDGLADDLELVWNVPGGAPDRTTSRIRREAARLRGGL